MMHHKTYRKKSICLIFCWLSFTTFALQACQCGRTTKPISFPGRLAVVLENNRTLLFKSRTKPQEQIQEFLLFNQGPHPLELEQFKIVPENSPFELVSPNSFPFALPVGQNFGIRVAIRFVPPPNSTGFEEARLQIFGPEIENIDQNGSFRITLRHQLSTPKPHLSCTNGLDFGQVSPNAESILACYIRNQGDDEFVITSVSYTPEKGGQNDFQLKNVPLPQRLLPHPVGNLRLQVAYKPSVNTFESNGILHIFTDVPGEKENVRLALPVKGRQISPSFEILPYYGPCQESRQCDRLLAGLLCQFDAFKRKTLCTLPPGEDKTRLRFPFLEPGQAAQRQFEIHSKEGWSFEIKSILLDTQSNKGYRIIPDGITLPKRLLPQETFLVSVEFKPEDAQIAFGRVEVKTDIGTSSLRLESSDRGCNLRLSPAQEITLLKDEKKQIILNNVGNESCTVDLISLSPKDPAFTLFLSRQIPAQLKPGEQLTITLGYTAPDDQKHHATLVIQSSDPAEPELKLPITGSNQAPSCVLSVSPKLLQFGRVEPLETKSLRFTLANVGLATCEITDNERIRWAGTLPAAHEAFSLSIPSSYPLKLQPNQTLEIEVSLTPTLAPKSLALEGKVIIPSNDPQNPTQEVLLKSSIVSHCLQLQPNHLTFASTQTSCESQPQTLGVFFIGGAGCPNIITVQQATVQHKDPKEFQIKPGPSQALPFAMRPNDLLELSVTYKPSNTGKDQAQLEITHSLASQSPQNIPLEGTGVSTTSPKDIFTQNSHPIVDILFVVDNSCSMSDERASLANNIQGFFDHAKNMGANYHVMITTTDTSTQQSDLSNCGIVNLKTGPKIQIITPKETTPSSIFTFNIDAISEGSGVKKGLEAVYRALSPGHLNNRYCHKGFLRPNADLAIIFLSDEDDYSPAPNDFYVSFLKSLKPKTSAEQLFTTAIVGPLPNGCVSNTTTAQAAQRYHDVVQKTAGQALSICNPSWSNQIAQISAQIFNLHSSFPLSRIPNPNTLVVKVNGSIAPASAQHGWNYNANSNKIIFSPSAVPPPLSQIEIQYVATCPSSP